MRASSSPSTVPSVPAAASASSFDRETVRVDQRAHHVGRVAHALLVGEGRDRDRTGRHEPCAPQGRDDLEAGQHAVAAIVDAGVDDRVDV
jgi:hypothetical protein